jgi:hypothetical protein
MSKKLYLPQFGCLRPWEVYSDFHFSFSRCSTRRRRNSPALGIYGVIDHGANITLSLSQLKEFRVTEIMRLSKGTANCKSSGE